MTAFPLEIRPLVPADQQDWSRLWTAYLAFYSTVLPAEVHATTWERLLGDGFYDPRGMIARQNGQAVGLVQFLLHRSGWKIEPVTYMQDLYVEPWTRGTGVGRALIEAVYAEADRLGAPAVYWLTNEGNYTARQLYDRVGVQSPFLRYNRPA
ncbi:GNAT family N-acetyltransferase [Frigidibacter sp.]|uniref:GNAT family N-acetyltransferase n=1 Tax=Frigidibacter sp. TaxID=2586418 RepID=UPI002736AF04|nr:GNAT family N-acetyltransferase [Frigidibacter sp.]MDP3339818.1 GNAT family N-acetyltransferase [Frigidibacter sp.]